MALAATLATMHKIPVSGLVLLLGVDRFLNEARAVTNLIGNGVATIVVARWEGALDMDKARAMLNRTADTSIDAIGVHRSGADSWGDTHERLQYPAPHSLSRPVNFLPSTAAMTKQSDTTNFREAALDYHEFPTPGKIAIAPTKQMINQRDLSLAYSPGVAFACEEIVENPLNAARFTARSNLVGVVTNGTAVLGLGNIGPLASKPVMEGKAVLFKKFAGIDVFDIELNESDPHKLVDVIAALEPTFGGINLEDIKAPDCFIVERECRKRMKIPVFHDDQHGTAIVVAAAIINGLKVVGKNIKEVNLVASGAGAAALACLDLLVDLGLPLENILVTDLAGVVYKGRAGADGPGQGAICARNFCANARGSDQRRRHLPRPISRRCAQAGHGQADGRQAADPGAGQPDAGNPAGTRAWKYVRMPSSLPDVPTIRTR